MAKEFGILGPVEVRTGGKRVQLGGAKQRTLLAALLLEPNRVVAADRLVELLRGDEPPETAANNLQVYISQLRRALEPERAPGAPAKLLLSQSSGYLLVVGADQLDLHRFERLAEEGRKALAAGDAYLSARTLRAALALWQGPTWPTTSLEGNGRDWRSYGCACWRTRSRLTWPWDGTRTS